MKTIIITIALIINYLTVLKYPIMQTQSLESIKELKPVVLNDQEMKAVKGGDGIISDDIIGF